MHLIEICSQGAGVNRISSSIQNMIKNKSQWSSLSDAKKRSFKIQCQKIEMVNIIRERENYSKELNSFYLIIQNQINRGGQSVGF